MLFIEQNLLSHDVIVLAEDFLPNALVRLSAYDVDHAGKQPRHQNDHDEDEAEDDQISLFAFEHDLMRRPFVNWTGQGQGKILHNHPQKSCSDKGNFSPLSLPSPDAICHGLSVIALLTFLHLNML